MEASISGIVEARDTFLRKSDGTPFDVLELRTEGGEVERALCGRAHIAQLLKEHDPQPGDGVAITCFGQEPDGNRFLYAMRVERAVRSDVDAEAAEFAAPGSQDAEMARVAQEPLGVE